MTQYTGIRKDHILFCIGWAVFCFSLIFVNTIWTCLDPSGVIDKLLQLMRYCAYFICIISIFLKKIKISILSKSILIMIVFVLSFCGSRSKTYILYFLIMLAAVHVKDRYIVEICCISQLCVLIPCVLLSQLVPKWDFIFVHETRIRHGLGLSYALVAPVMFFYLLLGYIYIRREKISYFEYIVAAVIGVWLFKMTDSRMAFFMTELCVLYFVWAKLWGNRWRIQRKFSRLLFLLPWIISFFSILIHYIYNPRSSMWRLLNRLLSGRLSYGKDAFDKYGINLFGAPVQWIGYTAKTPDTTSAVGYNYVDCSYVQILVSYGLIFLFVVLLLYTCVVCRAIKIGDYFLVSIIFFVLMMAITEPRLMNFAYNPFVMLAFSDLDIQNRWLKKNQ